MTNGAARSALRAFVVKEFHHILRDRQTLLILLLMPLVEVLLFGYALRNDIHDIRLAIVDPAPDAATTRLRSRFAGNGRFRVVSVTPSPAPLESLFRRGSADAAVVFQPRFGERLARGMPARLLLVTDASDPNTGSVMQAYATAVIGEFQRDLRGAQPGLTIPVETQMRFNPSLASVNLFVPGLIALVLTLVSALMTAISLSREKERGTLEVLLVSPLRPRQIIVGKVLPYLTLSVANVVTAIGAGRLVFGVPMRGSFVLLLAESLLYTIVSLALGVLIAARTPSQRAAMIGALAGTMLPNVILSGLVFPIASMPVWLHPFTYLVPARWFIVIARGIMLKGVGLDHLWRETAILGVMMLVLLAVSVRSFRPRLA